MPTPFRLHYLFVAVLAVAVLRADDHRLALLIEGGVPVSERPVTILMNTGYAVGYSEDLKLPLWTAYRLGNRERETVAPTWHRPYRFKVDTRTVSRISHDDYVRTFAGVTWDRGHMAPDAAMESQYGQAAQLETYFMTNICPQTSLLNRGLWANLEAELRNVISQDDTRSEEVHDLFVICGPAFTEAPIKRWPAGIAVPDYFYCIVAYQKGYNGAMRAAAFMIPQLPAAGARLQDFIVSVDAVEVETGINFFPDYGEIKQRNLEQPKRDLRLIEVP